MDPIVVLFDSNVNLIARILEFGNVSLENTRRHISRVNNSLFIQTQISDIMNYH